MDAVTTTVVTIYFAQLQIIGTTISIAIISDNLTRAEEVECGRKPEHIEDSKDKTWHKWENDQRLNFTNDLCSNLKPCIIVSITFTTDVACMLLMLTFKTGVAIRIRRTIAIEDRKAMIITAVMKMVTV